MPALRDWGVRDYAPAWAEMRELRAARRHGLIPDTLLLVEHPPVITVGVQGDDGETFPRGVPVYRVERGGKSTFHGPGQLVGYPIVDLDPRGRDVRRFVHEVEEVVIRSVEPLGVAAAREAGRRGVWVGGERKLASVGIAVEEWVTFHGFALNVSTDLAQFAAFHPCGFDPSVMTSLERERGQPTSLGDVKPHVVAAWRAIFADATSVELRPTSGASVTLAPPA